MTNLAEVLVIRHGQTNWNIEKRLQGHCDVPLNEKGIEQALLLADTLKEEKVDAIYSSDLSRAYKTAEEIAKYHQLPVHQDARLRERSYGAFEGLSREEVKTRYPESHALWYAADPDHVFPPGNQPAESMRNFHNRVIDALCDIASHHVGQKIVVVAHFGIIEAAYRVVNNIPIDVRSRVPVLNTSINRFLIGKDHIELVTWAESSHLDQ